MTKEYDQMVLPEYILNCINVLESAGFEAYCVGGCVRDSLLGLVPQDYDLCTNAVPEQLRAVFHEFPLVLAGEKHGTVSVVTSGTLVEITTFRAEGGYRDNRHPDWVRFVTNIQDDLSRRDFTVNAMAFSPTRGFVDPWGGRADLAQGVLRAVGNAETRFQEDALRILRGVRFCVRYGLTPDPSTENAMYSQAYRLDSLAKERVFSELCKLLPWISAKDLIRFSPVFAQVIPELAPTVGFDQHSPHHAYDLFTHIAHVVEAVPNTLPLRLAALLHDIGKVPTYAPDENGRGHFYGHAKTGAQMANDILLRLKAPSALRERTVRLIELHMTKLEPDKKIIRRWLGKLGEETLRNLLSLQEADMGSKGTGKREETSQFSALRAAISEVLAENACLTVKDLAVDGNDLLRLGFPPNKALGNCLETLLQHVQDETVPNEADALLKLAQNILTEHTEDSI